MSFHSYVQCQTIVIYVNCELMVVINYSPHSVFLIADGFYRNRLFGRLGCHSFFTITLPLKGDSSDNF